MEAARPIAMIPSDCFRWQPRVQFIDSFRTREAALSCAFEHGYNLIVERSEGRGVLFDVLDDPEGACTSGLDLELLKTEEVIVDPYAEGWTSLMLSAIWKLTSRIGAAVAGMYVRQVAPRLRQTASRRNREALERAVRHAWRRTTRTFSAGSHIPSWHSPIPASCKVKTFSLSTARVHARRIVARAVAFHHREIVPFCRSEASRAWWSSPAIALRRGWRRYSQGSVTDAAKRLAAETSVLYAREVVPRLRDALTRCRQADFQSACRQAKGILVLTAIRLTEQLRYALGRCRQADFQGMRRRAWRTMLLTAIRLTDRFAVAVAQLYAREVAPRLHRAAARYQQADFEGTFRRSIEAVAPPQHSNSSQLS